jgi:hypothetical protein
MSQTYHPYLQVNMILHYSHNCVCCFLDSHVPASKNENPKRFSLFEFHDLDKCAS